MNITFDPMIDIRENLWFRWEAYALGLDASAGYGIDDLEVNFTLKNFRKCQDNVRIQSIFLK